MFVCYLPTQNFLAGSEEKKNIFCSMSKKNSYMNTLFFDKNPVNFKQKNVCFLVKNDQNNLGWVGRLVKTKAINF